jgi:PAS domain S-box-containing protein
MGESIIPSKYSRRSLSKLDLKLKFRVLFETPFHGIGFFNRQGQLLEQNPAWSLLFKPKEAVRNQEFQVRTLLDWVITEERQKVELEFNKILSSQTTSLNIETQVSSEDEEIKVVLLKMSRIVNQSSELLGFIATVQDITEKRKLESSLVAAAKLATLGEMAGGIAHEINNPLTAVQLRASRMLNQLLVDKFTQEMGIEQLNKILETTERIAKIVRGLKSFTRNDSQDPVTKVQLTELFDSILGLCSEKFTGTGIKLEVHEIPNLSLDCRGVQIEQVIINLLNNSNDAIHELKDKWIEVSFKVFDKKLQIFIKDSGHGIPDEILKKIMQPFFTTKAAGKGTGLGLSISKKIMAAHGGRLFYDNSSKNTCFVIELPMQSP